MQDERKVLNGKDIFFKNSVRDKKEQNFNKNFISTFPKRKLLSGIMLLQLITNVHLCIASKLKYETVRIFAHLQLLVRILTNQCREDEAWGRLDAKQTLSV